jgi:four helix bundle suffix protein
MNGELFERWDGAKNPGREHPKLIPLHGGFRGLKSFRIAQLVYDVTVRFCDAFIEKRSRTHDQMVQAARSGVQNIAEGSQVSGTSKKMELKLTNVARASLEELRLDYEDFLRQRGMVLWPRDDPRRRQLILARPKTADAVAAWVKSVHKSPHPSPPSMKSTPSTPSTPSMKSMKSMKSMPSMKSIYSETAANAVLALIAVACSLLKRQIAVLEAAFEREGGFTERLFKIRHRRRGGH